MNICAPWGSDLLAIAVAVVTLLLGNCASVQARGSESKPSKKSGCGIEGFTKSQSEHIVVQLDEPFRVKAVEGMITSEGGEWPEGVFVLFELRPTDGTSKLRRAKTDSQGFFKIPDVPPGEYCFKATMDGWQSVVGVIVVSKTADPARRVSGPSRDPFPSGLRLVSLRALY